MVRSALALLFAALSAISSVRQTAVYDVFVNSAISGGKAGLFFVDARTGLSTIAVTNGINHTILGSGVIFLDKDTGKVGVAYPDGRVETHPFIAASDAITWVVSADRGWVAWAVGHTESNSLLTDLFVARADGSDKQQVLHTSSTKAVAVRPLAISNDGATVYYTRQADDPKAYRVYPTAADIYRLNVGSGESTHVMGEPRCPCDAAFSANGQLLFRLEGAPQGFAAHFIDLSAGIDVRLDAPTIAFTQAGYALLSDKGDYAVYSMARGTPPAKGTPPEQYLLVLADAGQGQQRVILQPGPNRLRPFAFERDTLILTGADKDGTYKLSLSGGALTQVSAYTFLGTISQ